jgi:AhpD family alkylhydroperoxidase
MLMTIDYTAQASKVHKALTILHDEIPQTMAAFTHLAEKTMHEGVLNKKTKELLALAIAIYSQSQDCITFHIQNLLAQDMRREELLEVIAVCSYMGGGPKLMSGVDALAAFDKLNKYNG